MAERAFNGQVKQGWRAGGDGRGVSFGGKAGEVLDRIQRDARELAEAQADPESYADELLGRYPDLGQHDDITQERLDDPDIDCSSVPRGARCGDCPDGCNRKYRPPVRGAEEQIYPEVN